MYFFLWQTSTYILTGNIMEDFLFRCCCCLFLKWKIEDKKIYEIKTENMIVDLCQHILRHLLYVMLLLLYVFYFIYLTDSLEWKLNGSSWGCYKFDLNWGQHYDLFSFFVCFRGRLCNKACFINDSMPQNRKLPSFNFCLLTLLMV